MNFYVRSLHSLISNNILLPEDSILVLAGGSHDRESLLAAGCRNAIISNLDYHAGVTEYAPFPWMRLDAERIDQADESHDWVLVYAGLHHLGVPAQGVCEMFRVCRKGILCFEARDSLAMKLAVKLTLSGEYELESAFLADGATGGYRNGPIPNYVYRWTEREFEKVIKSFHPAYQVEFRYFYGLQVPMQAFEMSRSAVRRLIGRFINSMSAVFMQLFPRQGNQFAMVAVKTKRLQAWLRMDGDQPRFRNEALAGKYDKDKYK